MQYYYNVPKKLKLTEKVYAVKYLVLLGTTSCTSWVLPNKPLGPASPLGRYLLYIEEVEASVVCILEGVG